MSKAITDKLQENFIRRMRNWARAKAGLGSIGYASMQYGEAAGGGTDGYRESPVPILGGEADDTDDALAKLPIRYSQAVSLFWQYEGLGLAALARRCGVGVDYRTFESRVIEGHERLKGELAKSAEKFRAYRAHAEAA